MLLNLIGTRTRHKLSGSGVDTKNHNFCWILNYYLLAGNILAIYTSALSIQLDPKDKNDKDNDKYDEYAGKSGESIDKTILNMDRPQNLKIMGDTVRYNFLEGELPYKNNPTLYPGQSDRFAKVNGHYDNKLTEEVPAVIRKKRRSGPKKIDPLDALPSSADDTLCGLNNMVFQLKSDDKFVATAEDKNEGTDRLSKMIHKLDTLSKIRDRLLVSKEKSKALLQKMVETENIYLSVWKLILQSPINNDEARKICDSEKLAASKNLKAKQDYLLSKIKFLNSVQKIFGEIKKDSMLHHDILYIDQMQDINIQNTLILCNFKIFLKIFRIYNEKNSPTIAGDVFDDSNRPNNNHNHDIRGGPNLIHDILFLLYNCDTSKYNLNINTKRATTNLNKNNDRNDLINTSISNLMVFPLKERSQRMIRDVLIIDAYVNSLEHLSDVVNGMIETQFLLTNYVKRQ
ncbi:unnamed protein product [Gordionus sp. m RMFG-2023]|uniref:uncharacterized protein LOC135926359 isoform X2 n=1 Tax=Gordionus sp. m RMFG-2023 TaxID=3053472 RepID=UPI0030E4C348